MMSTSLVASCFRMANISSCLRMVLAFSTWCSSAKASNSVGDLTLRSWSFISRIGGSWEKRRRDKKSTLEREESQVLGERASDPMSRPILTDPTKGSSACVRGDGGNIGEELSRRKSLGPTTRLLPTRK